MKGRLGFLSIDEETRKSYLFLIKWVLIALLGGISATLGVRSFSYLLRELSKFSGELESPWIYPACDRRDHSREYLLYG